MKKIKLLFALAILFWNVQNTQAQFAVGTKMLGLSVEYSSIENGSSNFTAMVAPEVYFFPSENYAIGGSFLILKQEISSQSGSVKTLEELNSKGLSLGMKIFTRGEHAFKFYANPALMILFSDGQNFKDNTLESTVRGNSGGFVLGSGFIYMVNKNMGLNFSTGPILSFLGTSKRTTGNGISEPVTNFNTEFKIMPNVLSSLAIGFNYIF